MAKPVAKLLSMLTPKRRWAQFSLLTLLAVVTVLCVVLSLVVVPAERQRRAVAAIESLGGMVVYAESPRCVASEPHHTPFLRRWLPWDYFDEVRLVQFHFTQVTDAGLAHLQGLTGLKELYLDRTEVTGTGVAKHVEALPNCRVTWASDTLF
jgi:hypothetical protein